MSSPQAGPLETKHLEQVIDPQGRSVRPKGSLSYAPEFRVRFAVYLQKINHLYNVW